MSYYSKIINYRLVALSLHRVIDYLSIQIFHNQNILPLISPLKTSHRHGTFSKRFLNEKATLIRELGSNESASHNVPINPHNSVRVGSINSQLTKCSKTSDQLGST